MSTHTSELTNLSTEELKRLSKQKNNIVLEYKQAKKLKESEIVPIQQVKHKIQRLRKIFLSSTSTTTTKVEILQLRKRLIQKNKEWNNFYQTHPCIFEMVTDQKTTDHTIQKLYDMIKYKEERKTFEDFQKTCMT
jgi:hypothetical protein